MNTDKIYAESIAKEYAPSGNSKIIALRKLDAKAKRPSAIFTYTFGIISSLIAGLGMCLSMQVIGGTLPLTILGIVIGIIGFTCCGINYPIYKKMLERGKKKYAFEIVQLAKEISEEK
ncbi:MAG: dihydropteridine reductase [Ruminococcaceae bacterium]|nr:dihydropteridine reductase [Oscillospiraceae bacterium]MBO5007031.1 dihydropteridine reductase [Clostridia bacterium]